MKGHEKTVILRYLKNRTEDEMLSEINTKTIRFILFMFTAFIVNTAMRNVTISAIICRDPDFTL